MVTLLIILMMVCNLWVLFYLTWEHRETRKSDRKDDIEPAWQEPMPDIMGKSMFRISDWIRTEKDTAVPEAATSAKAEAVDEKDVTFADELKEDEVLRRKRMFRAKYPMKIWTRCSRTTELMTRMRTLTKNRRRRAEAPLTKSTVPQGR